MSNSGRSMAINDYDDDDDDESYNIVDGGLLKLLHGNRARVHQKFYLSVACVSIPILILLSDSLLILLVLIFLDNRHMWIN